LINVINEFALGLDLKLHTNGLFKKVHEFDMTLFSDNRSMEKFHKLVFNNNGVLEEESNYFWIYDEKLSYDGSKACTLRNTRVILYWRGLELDEHNVKRILTLGLDFLIFGFTKEELIFKIRTMIPTGTYDVAVKYNRKSYCLITIEQPLFIF
jgi:hypothetical protein